MSDMYGTTFTKSHGVNPDGNNVWGAVLAGLTKEQVTKGLRVLAESGREFPPSAPVFKQMCLTKSVNEYHQQIIQEERERQSRLPKPTTKEKGIQAIQAMKKNIGKPAFNDKMEAEFQKIFGRRS